MESSATMIRRRRPILQTCVVSMTRISGKASKMIKDYDKPIGLMLKRTLILASTTRIFIYMMKIQWLTTVLAFIDKGILIAEQNIEALFPPSSHVFEKIDKLVESIECLPGKFDDATNKLESAVGEYPFMEWALVHGVSWLNLMVSIFTSCGSESWRERDIMVDINCNCEKEESRTEEKFVEKTTSPTSVESAAGTITKFTYKEVVEKGKNENLEMNKDGNVKEAVTSSSSSSSSSDDPILDLFESGWHMKPANNKGGMPSPMASSASLDSSCR